MTIRTLAVAAVLPLLFAATACGDDSGGKSGNDAPADVLADAKKSLDETSGVHLVLETDKLPDGLSGVVKAEGTANHQPAFEGTIKVAVSGTPFDVKVIAVDGKVWAVIPFTTKYTEIDAEDYGAPDPAGLMDPESGISAWLTRAKALKEGKQTREGADVLTSYTGTLDGESVVSAIPSADSAGTFDVTFTIDNAAQLRSATVTGPFYKGKGDVTYDVTLTDYDTDEEIKAP